MKRKLFLIALFFLLGGLIVSCGPKKSEELPSELVAVPIIAQGRLLPINALDLSFTVGGQVEEILIDDGESVRKGQLLVRLVDSPEAQSTLAGAQKEALAARQELEDYIAAADVNLAQGQIEAILAGKRRTTALNNYNASRSRESTARLAEAEGELAIAEETLSRLEENDGLDPEELKALEARVEAANAAEASAQALVDALELTAPMAGTVVDVKVITGQRVKPGEVVMAVADFSEFVVETDNLTEVEVVDIEEGQKVEIILDALPDKTLMGVVEKINERFEEKRGDITFTVNVRLTQTDPLMRWGMTAAVRFIE